MGLSFKRLSFATTSKICEGRSFWPKDIWSITGRADRLADDPVKALKPHGHKCAGARTDSLMYLEALQEPTVSFCAIPQVMAIATSQLC